MAVPLQCRAATGGADHDGVDVDGLRLERVEDRARELGSSETRRRAETRSNEATALCLPINGLSMSVNPAS